MQTTRYARDPIVKTTANVMTDDNSDSRHLLFKCKRLLDKTRIKFTLDWVLLEVLLGASFC